MLAPPSAEHLLGGDSAGRDILSRLIFATSTSLLGAFIAVLVAALIGVTAGLIAGYRGGWFDTVSNWMAGVVLSLPAIVILLAARAVIGPSIWWIMAIFGIVLSASYYRIVYGAVRNVRQELYIDAARVAGLSDLRIVGRHVLTAVRAPVILLTTGLFAVAIAIQASLDFLGVGDPSLPTWGGMLSEGFYNLSRTPWLMVWPSIAIALTCIALSLFGTALRDVLEQSGAQTRGGPARWAPPAPRPDAAVRHDDAAEADPLLEIDGLSVAYRNDQGWKTVVDDVSLTVRRGEVHALIGESGSGKTQTAWSVLGLLPEGGTCVAGAIRFDGKDLLQMSARELGKLRGRRIGYVPQEPMSNLDPSYTVGHQLVKPLQYHARTLAAGGEGSRAGAAGARGDRRPRTHVRRLSAPDLRRHGPARPHRRRRGDRAGPDHRRRTDDGARRHRPGRDPPAPARPPARERDVDPDRDAQLRGRRRPRRPGLGDAGGKHRRDRLGRRRLRRPPARVHPRAVRGTPRRRPRTRSAARMIDAPASGDSGARGPGASRSSTSAICASPTRVAGSAASRSRSCTA